MPAETERKHRNLEQRLRRRILRGSLTPGSRLPTWDALQLEFGVSRQTVQRAVGALRNDGFIVANGKAGTFVADRPPHLANYGFVFTSPPPWSRFYQTLYTTAMEMAAEASCRLTTYYSLLDRQRLIADVQGHRIAGLIFAHVPHELIDTPVLLEPGMPRVGINAVRPFEGMNAVNPDYADFERRAVEYLTRRGRARIASLWLGPVHQNFLSCCRRGGVQMRPHWHLEIGVDAAGSARQITQLLLDRPANDRPNALVIGDDNLLEHVIAGISASGVSVPQELEILTHWNFFEPDIAGCTVRRLGFDCPRIIRHCFQIISNQRRGLSAPRITEIPAMFEEELEDVQSASLR